MASKRRKTVEIKANYSTRRAKFSRQAKKLEDSKLISERATKRKIVISEIEKPKSLTGNKPQETNTKSSKLLKQRKVHNCTICLKVFKGTTSVLNF